MARAGGTRRRSGAGLLVAIVAGSCTPMMAQGVAPVQPPVPVIVPRQVLPALPKTAFALSGSAVQGALLHGTAPAGAQTLLLDGQPITFAADGAFIVAFDRDAKPTATLTAILADGQQILRQIAVLPRSWDIQSLPTLRRGTTPTPEFLVRRAEELRRINAARATATDAEGWGAPFLWPVTGRISGVFGSQRIYAGEPGAYHAGVDIARPAGTPIVAPADGVVILAADAPFTLEGNLLMVDHGMGLNSAFLHLSRILVREGEHVTRGQTIGLIGMTGRATGPHLHWAVKWRDRRIDPALLAGPMPGARGLPDHAEAAGD